MITGPQPAAPPHSPFRYLQRRLIFGVLFPVSARTAEIKAERAVREAADDYYVQASRQAEAETAAEPAAAPADDVDAGMEMEPG